MLRGGNPADYYLKYAQTYPYPMGSYGSMFISWIHLASRGIMMPYNSCGNGSAMRVAPVGWGFNTLEETLSAAKLSAECTHNHPEGIKGAQATAMLHTAAARASHSYRSMLSPVSLPKVAVVYAWRTASAMSYRSSRTKGQTSLSGCLATPWCRYIIVATSSLVAKSQTSASSNGVQSMSSKRARGYSSNACRKA
jgi:ADP-ribosylglycohydrolase